MITELPKLPQLFDINCSNNNIKYISFENIKIINNIGINHSYYFNINICNNPIYSNFSNVKDFINHYLS